MLVQMHSVLHTWWRRELLLAGNLTIAESLILPAAMDMVKVLLDEKEAMKLKAITLSNDTIQRRITDISMDIKEQFVQ